MSELYLRLDHEGAVWHVTSRGNERREIFRDDEDRERLLTTRSQGLRHLNGVYTQGVHTCPPAPLARRRDGRAG